MTRETLEFLRWMLARQIVTVGDPDAEAVASRAFTALREIDAALAEHTGT